MREFGPIPILSELQQSTPWVWLCCEHCQHHSPIACAVAVIRWVLMYRVIVCDNGRAALHAAVKRQEIASAFNRYPLSSILQKELNMTASQGWIVIGLLVLIMLGIVGLGAEIKDLPYLWRTSAETIH